MYEVAMSLLKFFQESIDPVTASVGNDATHALEVSGQTSPGKQ